MISKSKQKLKSNYNSTGVLLLLFHFNLKRLLNYFGAGLIFSSLQVRKWLIMFRLMPIPFKFYLGIIIVISPFANSKVSYLSNVKSTSLRLMT